VNELLVFFAQNTLGASILAIGVYTATRMWRNPSVAHVLWLLVLAKLVAPPLVGVDWKAVTRLAQSAAPERTVTKPSPPLPSHVASDRLPSLRVAGELTPPRRLPQMSSNNELAPRPIRPVSAIVATAERRDTDVLSSWQRGSQAVFWLWLAGAAYFATTAAMRVARFSRRLRCTLPASERFQVMGREIGERFGVRRAPDIRYIDSGGPLVYCLARRPVILLPIGLSRHLDDEQASMILAHEMAHLCRRDQWVRFFELIVSTVYWWNPLVWFVRRQLHCAEEQCCDAWVRWAYPDSARRYAEVVLLAVDSLNVQTVLQPQLASSFLGRHSVKARIEMILKNRFAPRLSPRGKALFCLLALVALPLFVQSATSHAQQNSDFARQAIIEAASAKPSPPLDLRPSPLRAAFEAKFSRVPEQPSEADFPHVVHFEQGASKLLQGDRIDITEVRGTATTMSPGNVYWIKGTYTLASHDRAGLMVSVTAAKASEGTGSTLKTQSVDVTKGSGTFTLIYAMICQGWPHVSFYPKGNGSDFGGTYFGTGEFVLRQWWGEGHKSATNPDNSEFARLALEPLLVTRNAASTSDFPYVVPFELGETRFLPGDRITITEVRGSADSIALRQIYCVKGRYTLASHDRAQLSVGITADNAADGTRTGFKPQDTIVNKGEGTFTLLLPMACKGWPHVSFYPADGGNGFGGVYFGSEDSLAKPVSEKAPGTAKQDALEGQEPKLLPSGVPLSQRLWDDLGLRVSEHSLSLGESLLPYERALAVTEVRPGSPASNSSIRVQDGLIGIDGYATESPRNVLWVLNHRREGNATNSKLRFLMLHEGRLLPIDVTMPPRQ
jgi:beta-lactamase regulating signal transducer with metallopeptidase domain